MYKFDKRCSRNPRYSFFFVIRKLKMRRTLLRILKIEIPPKIWRRRNLTVWGKVTVLKTFRISKVIHLALVTNVPQALIG